MFIPVGIRYGERIKWRKFVEIKIGPPLSGEGGLNLNYFIHKIREEIRRLSGMLRIENIL